MSDSKSISGQLPIDLPHAEALTRDDLIESQSNSQAIELVDSWPQWPGSAAVLAGPVGSGKSHIGKVWAQAADATIYQCSELTKSAPYLDKPVNVLLENASGEGLDENALFHLMNNVRAHSKFLLITTREWPSAWNISLPDLSSRLRAAQLVELNEPDDQLLRQVLVKLFADRQLNVDMSIVDYCLLRMERSLASAQRLVARLDSEALARNTKITRAMAKEILALSG